ncbi:expressed unknown protein [Seminavis robusta]|uniref:Uncharacterized protein n=1 Tax=Seminavis robusta TaxID=568900 RepID=A0A9N8D9F3_9STRA|nr:expressed unknown protein [Seminavis robusta]|eukprot:Sro8_g006480.1 n/a (598) ;mRNA; f:13237-15030
MSITEPDVQTDKDALLANLLEGVAENALDNFKEGALGLLWKMCDPALKDLTGVQTDKDALLANLLEGVAKNALDHFEKGALGLLVKMCGPALKDLDKEQASTILSCAVKYGYKYGYEDEFVDFVDYDENHPKHYDEDILALALALPRGYSISRGCWKALMNPIYSQDFVQELMDTVGAIESDSQTPLYVTTLAPYGKDEHREIEFVGKTRLAMAKATAIRFNIDLWRLDSFVGLLAHLLRDNTQNRSVKCLHITDDDCAPGLDAISHADDQGEEQGDEPKAVAAALKEVIGEDFNPHIEALFCTTAWHCYVLPLIPIFTEKMPNLKTIHIAGCALSEIMPSLKEVISKGVLEELSIDEWEGKANLYDILDALEKDGMGKLAKICFVWKSDIEMSLRVRRSPASVRAFQKLQERVQKELEQYAKQLVCILETNTVLTSLTLQYNFRDGPDKDRDVFDVVEVDRNGEEIRLGRTIQLQLALNRCGRGVILHGGSSLEDLLLALSNVETDEWLGPFLRKESSSRRSVVSRSQYRNKPVYAVVEDKVEPLEETEKALRIIDLTFSFLRAKPDLWVWHAVAQNNWSSQCATGVESSQVAPEW